MGIFDIFSNTNAAQAAQDQIAGIQTGLTNATNAINTGSGDLTTNYTAGLQPYLQNYGQATQGTTALLNALGLGGSSGNASAMAALQNTPGYQFQLNQGTQNVLRNAAQTGTTASGATLNALQNQGQGQAQTTYNNYVSQLQPFLNASNASAGGIGNLYSGLGNALNANQGSLANLNWQAATGIGNANANAQLANNAADANIWGAIGNLFGSGFNLAGGASTLSDERLKADIEPIGELYDGTNVYKFRYKWDDTPRIGLMAQEVEKRNPGAVTEIGGWKAVDYGKATRFASDLAKFLEAA